MSCPFNRDVYTGDPFLDWLGSTTGKPLSYYEGRYKKKKTETTDTTSKPEGVTVSTNDISGNWGFASQGAGISYNNTSSSNVSSNNYSVFRNTNTNTNTSTNTNTNTNTNINTNINTNTQSSLTHNVFKSGHKRQFLSNYNPNPKRLPLPWEVSRPKRLPLPYTIGGKQ